MRKVLSALKRALEFCLKNPSKAKSVVGIDSLVEKSVCPLIMESGADFVLSDSLSELVSVLVGFDSSSAQRKIELSKRALAVISKAVAIVETKPSLKHATEFFSAKAPARYVKGVGPKTSEILEKKGIFTVEDLLYFLPRTYQDRRKVKKIVELKDGECSIIVAEVIWSGERFTQSRRKIFEAQATDQSGILYLRWFNYSKPYLDSVLKVGTKLVLSGEVKEFRGVREMYHPDMERLEADDLRDSSLHFGRIVPIYSETEWLSTRIVRKLIKNALDFWGSKLVDPVPAWLLGDTDFPDVYTALKEIHFPPNSADLETLFNFETLAQKRLVFEELFLFSTGVGLRKREVARERGPVMNGGDASKQVLVSLPFELTNAQKRALAEIEDDLKNPVPMNRLLQGDVGSGKTVIAAIAAAIACDSGYQTAVMAPTEILARQHWRNFSSFLDWAGIKVELLVSDMPARTKEKTLSQLRSGKLKIVVGTHALIQEAVDFSNLGLAIIDEQHRFGVLQRAALKEKAKGVEPNILVMTATPIPRSLALTVYGDLDLSVIDEMPKGRKPVVTEIYYEDEREKLENKILERLKARERVFVVYPVIDESVDGELVGATKRYEELSRVFEKFGVGLIHGRMRSDKKDGVMRQFANGEINLLVATTVIEVGIDVPQATAMVVERADMFGLSQLHQLRGRVGRGEKRGYCFLVAPSELGESAKKRLSVLADTTDGFKIAEEDLKLRGPGEFLGTRQSGAPNFRITNLARDFELVVLARDFAKKLFERDPDLRKPEHVILRKTVFARWGECLKLADVG